MYCKCVLPLLRVEYQLYHHCWALSGVYGRTEDLQVGCLIPFVHSVRGESFVQCEVKQSAWRVCDGPFPYTLHTSDPQCLNIQDISVMQENKCSQSAPCKPPFDVMWQRGCRDMLFCSLLCKNDAVCSSISMLRGFVLSFLLLDVSRFGERSYCMYVF